MGAIYFFCEDIEFSVPHPKKLTRWIQQTILVEKHTLSFLNFIFCNDSYLLSMNEEYLQHHDFTDVITFSYAEQVSDIEGDIFISIDRVRENALIFRTSFENELYRVMIHGVLHLLGYKDKSDSDQKIMREKENSYLSLYYQQEKN